MRYAVLLIALAACGGSTEPTAPFALSLTPAASVQGHATVVNSAPAYSCDFPLAMTASGGGSGDYASWEGGAINWRLTSNGTVISTFVLGQDVTTWFGRDRIMAAQTMTTTRTLTWSGPFTASLVFNYSVATINQGTGIPSFQDRSTTVALTCS